MYCHLASLSKALDSERRLWFLSSSTFCRCRTTTICRCVSVPRIFSSSVKSSWCLDIIIIGMEWNRTEIEIGLELRSCQMQNQMFLWRIQNCSSTIIMANESVTPEWDIFFQTNPAPPDINLEETRITDFLKRSSSTDNPRQPMCLVTSGNIYQKIRHIQLTPTLYLICLRWNHRPSWG